MGTRDAAPFVTIYRVSTRFAKDARKSLRSRRMQRKVAPMARRRLCSPAMLRNEVPRRVVAVAMLLSAAASAQQITLSQTPDRRLYSDASKQATYRSASKYPDWVNYADCASNVLLHFQLAVSSIPTNGSLQVWAGTDDCTKTEARTGDTTRTCWPVSSTLSNTQNVSVDVQSQHIVEYLGKTASDKPKTFADLSTTPSADVCTSTSNGATAGPVAAAVVVCGTSARVESSGTTAAGATLWTG